MTSRLVTFLGTGKYQPVVYRDPASERCAPQTTWIARALAELHRPTEILVLATPKAEATHGSALLADLRSAGFTVELRTIDEGGEPQHLWQQFEAIKAALRAPAEWQVILDITHGFRSQPFFAASVVAFVRAVDENPPRLRVAYGGFEAKDAAGVAPIWDLTPFIDLLDWTREIMLFLRTGRAVGVAQRTQALGRALSRAWADGGRAGAKPTLPALAKALGALGRDLETVRTGAMLLGSDKAAASAAQLIAAMGEVRDSLAQHIPPLADVLDRIETMAQPLVISTATLNTPEGHAATAALAQLYLGMGRYSEAATTVREGLITLYAEDSAACPGRKGFDGKARESAETAWRTRDDQGSRTVAAIRNDIDHGGYRSRPLPADRLTEQIDKLVTAFADAEAKAAAGCSPVFLNISNHPSAEWEDAQRQAALACAPTILDIAFPRVTPEADEGAVATLRDAILAQVPAGTTHAMVQGEFTLAFALVRELSSRGILCLAATTERDVIDLENGEMQRRFRFVRFRSY